MRPLRIDPAAGEAPELSDRSLDSEQAPGREGHRETVQEKPDCQELDEAALGHGVNHAVAASLDLADHAGPSPQHQERGRQVSLPLLPGDTEDPE